MYDPIDIHSRSPIYIQLRSYRYWCTIPYYRLDLVWSLGIWSYPLLIYVRPDPLDKKNPYHPINIDTYKEIPIDKIPDTESLKDTYERVLEFYKQEIENEISNNNILISAHGNSIRALCKYLFELDENQISKLEIPTGNPLLITLDGNKKITDCKYLDDERAKDLVVF